MPTRGINATDSFDLSTKATSNDRQMISSKQSSASGSNNAMARFDAMLDGNFRVLQLLHDGLDCFTLECVETCDGQPALLKLLKFEPSQQATLRDKFVKESSSLRILTHYNICRCTGTGSTSTGQPYVTFEHLGGSSLKQILLSHSYFDAQRAVSIGVQITAALSAGERLHFNTHALSSRNIFLLTDELGRDVVKVFGIGLSEAQPAVGETFMQRTQNFDIYDSIAYMSPEECLSKDLDECSTVYSVGCLIYELLTGSVPFLGRTALETGNKHLSETAMLLSDVRPDLNFASSLEHVIANAIAKEPSKRYRTIIEFQNALKNCSTEQRLDDRSAIPKKIRVFPMSPSSPTEDGPKEWNLIFSARAEEDELPVDRGETFKKTLKAIKCENKTVSIKSQVIAASALGVISVLCIAGAEYATVATLTDWLSVTVLVFLIVGLIATIITLRAVANGELESLTQKRIISEKPITEISTGELSEES